MESGLMLKLHLSIMNVEERIQSELSRVAPYKLRLSRSLRIQ